MEKTPKTIYYHDELNDDFADNGIKSKPIKDNYRYINNSILFKITSFLLRNLFAVPVLWLVNTIFYRPKIKNKGLLKQLRHKGYYLYANHVLSFDPIVLPVKTQPAKRTIIIAGHELFSISGFVSWLVKHFDAIPTPNQNLEMMERFRECLSFNIKKGHRVLIYPEAHIWPYYNDIRNFKSSSFRYPVEDKAPVVVATTTFKKRKGNRKPKPIIYLDGPFYPNDNLTYHEQINDLRDRVYNAMKWQADREDNYAYIKYEKAND